MERAPDDPALLDLLGVDEAAPWQEVRQAFRNAVRASHPDLHAGDEEAERRLKTLNAGWESINTPGKWAKYVLPQMGSTPGGAPPRTPRAGAAPTVGRLRVHRERRGAMGLRNWQIECDGEVVASIENGAITVLDLAPGRHSLRIFYDRYSSLPLPIELSAGQELVLGCRQHESPRINLFSPGRSLLLERIGSQRFTSAGDHQTRR